MTSFEYNGIALTGSNSEEMVWRSIFGIDLVNPFSVINGIRRSSIIGFFR